MGNRNGVCGCDLSAVGVAVGGHSGVHVFVAGELAGGHGRAPTCENDTQNRGT